MKDAFPRATGLHKASETVGHATVADIRNAGFDVIINPTRKFPNHGRIVHPDGIAGFENLNNIGRLSNALTDVSTK